MYMLVPFCLISLFRCDKQREFVYVLCLLHSAPLTFIKRGMFPSRYKNLFRKDGSKENSSYIKKMNSAVFSDRTCAFSGAVYSKTYVKR